jgi:antitoxin component of MazEF toxin-antitoxin module
MIQKVIKTGNSLGVTIPSKFVKILGIRSADSVEVKVETAKSKITFTFHGAGQLSLLANEKK